MKKGLPQYSGFGAGECVALEICFWCNAEKGEVVRFERKEVDGEPREYVVANYEECPDCKQKWAMGIVLAEVMTQAQLDRSGLTKRPALQKRPELRYPTGRWLVVQRQGLRDMMEWNGASPTEIAQILVDGRACIDHDVFRQLAQLARDQDTPCAVKVKR